ncbi:MAG: ArsC family reductase [Rhodospirillales bacterium]
MLTIYGLKNCDTCRKARKWLDGKGAEYRFADLRADGFAREDLRRWVESAGWETLLNRRGTTWRGLDDSEKNISDPEAATALMAEHPALMKRPVFDFGSSVIVGFAAAQQADLEKHL